VGHPGKRDRSAAKLVLSWRCDHGQLNEACLDWGVIDALHRFAVVLGLGPEDTLHESLRIAIVEREPA